MVKHYIWGIRQGEALPIACCSATRADAAETTSLSVFGQELASECTAATPISKSSRADWPRELAAFSRPLPIRRRPGTREPWSFEDGPQVAKRIQREYPHHLLSSLPHLDDNGSISRALVDGYRALSIAMLQSARKCERTTDSRLVTTRAALKHQAQAARSIWQLVHLHLVAVMLADLHAGGAEGDELELVLIAEHGVEELTEDIEAG